ncbi:MAG: flagellar export protein FliJ [Lachnospiraceae bacterium]|nr:flagellar export protein FliJ [Lachnospiraceae bacterium]
MAKFRYRMQSILNIKLKMEEQAKMQFAQAQAKLNEEEEKLQKLIDRKSLYETDLKEQLQSKLNLLKIEELQNAVMRMEEFIVLQKREVDKAARVVEKERQKLTEVMMERKSHEKLKENAFEEFMQELNSAEGKEIDELTSYTYGQKNKN